MLSKDLEIKFNEQGLVPAIIQDAESNEVLMMAYMNRESIEKTLESGMTHFWSRSRNELWQKGETSGNIQLVQDVFVDCDSDALLIKVKQKGGACHTGHRSCFYRQLDKENTGFVEKNHKVFDAEMAYHKSRILQRLYDTVVDRKNHPVEGSYTNYLFEKGMDKILKKVGEESAEVIIAAKNRDEGELIYETADLIYHLIVALVEKGVTLDQVYEELEKRHKPTSKTSSE